jgi:hypothetical protein
MIASQESLFVLQESEEDLAGERASGNTSRRMSEFCYLLCSCRSWPELTFFGRFYPRPHHASTPTAPEVENRKCRWPAAVASAAELRERRTNIWVTARGPTVVLAAGLSPSLSMWTINAALDARDTYQ